jgi:four helix bundle protein
MPPSRKLRLKGQRPPRLRGASKEQLMSDPRVPIQKLDCYIVAKEIARRVHAANILDAELRDQATRAAKSTFLNLCEGLPQVSVAMRRKYFRCALGSLNETVGAVDLAEAIGALGASEAQAVAALAERLRRMLFGLTR